MDDFGFGVLGSIFASSGIKNDEAETKQKTTPRSDPFAEYTPPDIANFHQTAQAKQPKNNFVDTLLPVKVGQILENIVDGNQKLTLYNQPVGGICIIGQIKSVEKLTSAVHFQLADETGDITVNYTQNGFDANQGDYAQVVGSLVMLAADNYYVEAQHVMLMEVDGAGYKDVLKYHNVCVAHAAFHIDMAAKLKLQNKHSGKIVELPGQRRDTVAFEEITQVELGELYDHITEPVERLVLQYLKSRPDTLAKRSEIISCLSQKYVGK
ncbi:hypothetical protein BgAZ_502550 [Babesia gibsoni]|uniref:OB domain-containing protein n=1 Tax=Babesia gibsoni TaxID=33632 RepID=A0AAD8LM22_BABGI|nr:hypothetical protein BgAZ_502550 [Babesia gibsoni]